MRLLLNTLLFHSFFLQSVMKPASQQADQIKKVFDYFNVAAVGMLLLVIFLVTYICIRYRQKKGDSDDAVQTSNSQLLEMFMIGVPTLLLIFFFYQTVFTMNVVSPSIPHGRHPDVIITGHQWWWEVSYPAANVFAANEVHLPAGRQLLMEMRSADVIHDWWVPELGNKMDLVPNQNNYLWVNIHRPGKYTGACSEFCGAQHAWMRIQVIVQTEDDFNNWLTANKKEAVLPKGESATRGARLVQSESCGSCHRIAGTGANSDVGPDLTHLASRHTLLTGILENNSIDLEKWISHPQEVKPGAYMPDFNLDKDSLKAIVRYLRQLK